MDLTFWKGLKATHRASAAFIMACPLLALVPVVFELLQHQVETQHGMYDSIAGFQATGHNSIRLGFGFIKVVALSVPTYWITCFLATRDASFARRVDRAALRLFVPFLIVQLALTGI